MIMPALGRRLCHEPVVGPATRLGRDSANTCTNGVWEKTLQRRWEMGARLPVQHINVFDFSARPLSVWNAMMLGF